MAEQQYLAVRMVAYPHDVASIRAEDFDPKRHQIARQPKFEAPAVQYTPPAADVEAFHAIRRSGRAGKE